MKSTKTLPASRQAKKIIKIAVMIYLVSFLIINWNDISWIFNYRQVSGLINDFFNPYPSIDASTINAYFYPNQSREIKSQDANFTANQALEIKTAYTEKQNTLEIPAISVVAPIIFSTSSEVNLLTKDLDSGVVYYPGSVYPGQKGQIIILGHSAPPGWPKVRHDNVFTDIEKLNIGDSIYIDLNNKQYNYIVKSKKIINRGEDVPKDNVAPNTSILTLISCWPPGKDYQRITVTAELSDI